MHQYFAGFPTSCVDSRYFSGARARPRFTGKTQQLMQLSLEEPRRQHHYHIIRSWRFLLCCAWCFFVMFFFLRIAFATNELRISRGLFYYAVLECPFWGAPLPVSLIKPGHCWAAGLYDLSRFRASAQLSIELFKVKRKFANPSCSWGVFLGCTTSVKHGWERTLSSEQMSGCRCSSGSDGPISLE